MALLVLVILTYESPLFRFDANGSGMQGSMIFGFWALSNAMAHNYPIGVGGGHESNGRQDW